jgi:hypothetical protein
VNALDALIIAYNGISVLRQQTMPGDIIQVSRALNSSIIKSKIYRAILPMVVQLQTSSMRMHQAFLLLELVPEHGGKRLERR